MARKRSQVRFLLAPPLLLLYQGMKISNKILFGVPLIGLVVTIIVTWPSLWIVAKIIGPTLLLILFLNVILIIGGLIFLNKVGLLPDEMNPITRAREDWPHIKKRFKKLASLAQR